MTFPLSQVRILVGLVLTVSILGVGWWYSTQPSEPAGPASTSIPPANQTDLPAPSVPSPDGFGPPSTWAGPPFDADVASEPTAEKGQSKLWIHAGRWWAAMQSADGEVTIHYLDWGTQEWRDTSVLVDERGGVRTDSLAVGDQLWIVSAGRNEASASSHARLRRYTYDPELARYESAPGFPIVLTPRGAQGINIARDSTGHLWAVFVAEGQLWFTTTLDDDVRWTDPAPLPSSGTNVGGDEAVVVAHGDEVGVLWSNQLEDAVYYASHRAGDELDAWSTTRILVEGLDQADDHLNAKTLEGPGGGIFAVLKTSLDELSPRNNEKPLILLLALRDDDTQWRQSVVGQVGDRHSRPMLLVDGTHRQLYVFATSPGHTGVLHYKRATIDELAFAGGVGDGFLDRANIVTNPTSTKQPVTTATGMVVLAADENASRYVHGAISLGGVVPGTGAELEGAQPPGVAEPGSVVLFHDVFDHGLSSTLSATWRGSADPPAEVSLVTADDGGHARLSSPTGDAVAVCREAPPGSAPLLGVKATVEVANVGINDVELLTVRGENGQMASIRMLPNRSLAYTTADDKLAADAVLGLGEWYGIEVSIDLAAGRYAWALTDSTGAVVASRDAVPMDIGAGALERICFRTATGEPGSALLIDEVRVVR